MRNILQSKIREARLYINDYSLCIMYFQTIRRTPQIWEENGGASYSLKNTVIMKWVHSVELVGPK